MPSTLGRWMAAAALVLAAFPAAGQSRTPSQAAGTPSRNAQAKPAEVTLIGCVEPEKEYRARLDAAKGGPLGTGVGQGDEFVLRGAAPAPANGERATQQEAVATSGQRGDYMLTGKPEDELKRYVGRQVEVVGVVQPFEANESATEARDRLPRLAITNWHPVGDFCPAGKTP